MLVELLYCSVSVASQITNIDICHDESSPGYKATKNFKPFATMDECIKSGVRTPKAAEPEAKK